MDQNGYWCSVDSIFQNRMAMCEKECPLLARKLVQNYPGSTHTSCVPADSNAKILSPTPAEIQQILDLHNFMRSSVSPTSSDLKALSWVLLFNIINQNLINCSILFFRILVYRELHKVKRIAVAFSGMIVKVAGIC